MKTDVFKARPASADVGTMLDIDVLLQVDAGHVPAGVVAVFIDEEDPLGRRVMLVFALLTAGAAILLAFHSAHAAGPVLLALAAGIFGVYATPTLRRSEDQPIRRQVAVMTQHSIIIRDQNGLRTWKLDDLRDIVARIHHKEALLMLVDANGKEHPLPPLYSRRGVNLRALISQRLHASPRGV
jgi:hypothetical protein